MSDTLAVRPRVLVSGASRGIGRAIALRMAAERHVVCAVGRSVEALAALVAEALPGTVQAYPCDLLDPRQTAKLVEGVASHGSLRALVHCAAAVTRGRVEDLDSDALMAAFDENVTTAYRLTRGLLPVLGRGSTIVFLNSSQGRVPAAGSSHYAASKHALAGLADALRGEVNERGIRVTTLYPGRVATPAQEQLYADAGAHYRPELLLQPESIADVVANICALPDTAEVTELSIRPAIRSY
jgi:NAD(P)-dependent dehydrogenase (short-subunit alcohol dehydrogenase family)